MRQRFRVLRGKHQVFVGEHKDRTIHYLPGDVIETENDNLLRFNKPGSIKFELVPNDTPTKEEEAASQQDDSEEDAFAGMTVSQLVGLAEQDEVDLQGATKKADILAILRSHTVGA